jgi:hypothetical protein
VTGQTRILTPEQVNAGYLARWPDGTVTEGRYTVIRGLADGNIEVSEPIKDEHDRQVRITMTDADRAKLVEGLRERVRHSEDSIKDAELVGLTEEDCAGWRETNKLLTAAADALDATRAAWNEDRCFQLNAQQHDRSLHPYTCGNDSRHRPLIATPHGWRCADCDYRQDWAHEPPANIRPPAGGGDA